MTLAEITVDYNAKPPGAIITLATVPTNTVIRFVFLIVRSAQNLVAGNNPTVNAVNRAIAPRDIRRTGVEIGQNRFVFPINLNDKAIKLEISYDQQMPDQAFTASYEDVV